MGRAVTTTLVGSSAAPARWERVAPLVGIAGALAVTMGSVAAAAVYRGVAGEPYSPLDHYVSDLGELDVSGGAAIFNGSLVVGGACFAAFMLGVAAARGGLGAAAAGVAGILTGIAGALVGLFPESDPTRHQPISFAFFNLAWITIGLASLLIALRPDPRFPRWLAALGGLAVLSFWGFIAVYASAGRDADGARTWLVSVTLLEWAAIAAIQVWTIAVALAWRAGTRREAIS